MIPTLPQVQTYDPSHLQAAAEHWHTLAAAWEDTHRQALAAVTDVPWSGAGREAAHEAHAVDFLSAVEHADALRASATAAQSGYEDMTALHAELLGKVDKFQQANLVVAPDWTVIPDPKLSITAQLALASQAAEASAELKADAVRFGVHDADIAARVTAPATDFTGAAAGRVSMVDFTTDPIAPPDMPDPIPAVSRPPSGPSFAPQWPRNVLGPASPPPVSPAPVPSGPPESPPPFVKPGQRSPQDRQEDLIDGTLEATVAGALTGGLAAGVATEGAGAVQGAVVGGALGGIGYMLREAQDNY